MYTFFLDKEHMYVLKLATFYMEEIKLIPGYKVKCFLDRTVVSMRSTGTYKLSMQLSACEARECAVRF